MEFLARRKLTFLALIMGALLLYPFAPKSALAQDMMMPEVASNGVGDLLIFPYWTTMNRDTIIELTNTTSHTPVFTHVRFLDMSGEVLNEFTVGLCERDVWTAVLTAGMMNGDMMTMLQVVSPGKADGKVGDDNDYIEPPMADEDGVIAMLEIGEASGGYIEVFSMPEDPEVSDSATPLEVDGEDETSAEVAERLAKRINRDVITGAAFILNTGVGSGESVPATALVGFDAITATMTDPEDALVAENMMVADALAREGGVDKEILITHFNINPDIAGSTMMVITFPTGAVNDERIEDEDNPVSILAMDAQGFPDYTPIDMELDSNVNMLDVANLAGDDSRTFIGRGEMTEGWLRILDNDGGEEDAFPISRLPAIGRVFQSVENGAMSFNQSYPWQWTAMMGAGGYVGVESETTSDGTTTARTGTVGDSLKPSETNFRPWYQKDQSETDDIVLIDRLPETGTLIKSRMNRYALKNFFVGME